ncbi:hypothetical protein TPHA_0F00660 [Tetrapisispora phaffii CBS 4417]|uniref:DUF962 domain-containing protein n=1 Tax=Tetrapisispora phaffii (strain ATCC 24235 / CBS 4417 / NBRC 1672 / NRRL Y-8282 / UCD 70-5) TaxID=1071381 RepID=G8BUX0_TETPH|nr:hypothetical protein TPHA_0F00660 [Tetrapisispora phaffii CBS 4417]CCE63552.1 hypothetical protein TPHA_0F00660 [Tetrapisispora phaffii CBS 4417]
MVSDLFNLRTQLGFYKAYHHNTVNVMIHSVFVPTIFVTSCMILDRIPVFNNWSLTDVLSIPFATYYIILHRVVGLMASALIMLILYYVKQRNTSLKLEAGIWFTSWLFQFIGHGVFEKRKPALLDNLVQSLVLAPYFIFFEFLFVLGFYSEIDDQLKRDLKESKDV